MSLQEMPQVCVGLDARCLNTTHLRGMGKYVYELMGHISRISPIDWTLFADRVEAPIHHPTNISVRTDVFDAKGYRFHTWEQLALPMRVRQVRPQVLHCTATTLPYWQPVPTIVTIHDTLPWMNSDLSGYESWYLRHLIPSAFNKCWGIVTISEASRKDIVDLWPALDQKLHVIPHGVADAYLDAESGPLSPALQSTIGVSPYVLYIGGAVERKRFAWAVQLLDHLPEKNIRLVVCGFTEQERNEAIKSLKSEIEKRVCFLSFVKEADMLRLYQNAVAVLYPTLYEGFGFPALEAQALGTPVLFSALGSLQELQGPGAEVLPPYEMDAWVQTMKRLIAERATTRVTNEAARRWARGYSWNASAAKHAVLYKQAATMARI